MSIPIFVQAPFFSRRVALPTFDPTVLNQLLTGYERPEGRVGPEGLFTQLKKALAERALTAELRQQLQHEVDGIVVRTGADRHLLDHALAAVECADGADV